MFYGITAYAAIKIRREHPELKRPFSVPFFPLAPLVIMAVSLYLIVSNILASFFPSMVGIVFVAACFPVYYLFDKDGRKHAADTQQASG
eukprot:jgi/Mesen1/542/ME001041S10742